jgi:plastocyanin
MPKATRIPTVPFLITAAMVAIALPGCRADPIGEPPPGTVFVSARDSFFQAETVTVMATRSVRWTNDGTVYHTVVSDSLLWQSNLIAPRTWFEVRFDSTGTFDYHCSQHAGMTGTVIVQ